MEQRPGYMALVSRDTELQESHELAKLCIKRLREILDKRQDLTLEELRDLCQALFSATEVLKA
jgi:DNA-binding Xre family transcriptional regulator